MTKAKAICAAQARKRHCPGGIRELSGPVGPRRLWSRCPGRRYPMKKYVAVQEGHQDKNLLVQPGDWGTSAGWAQKKPNIFFQLLMSRECKEIEIIMEKVELALSMWHSLVISKVQSAHWAFLDGVLGHLCVVKTWVHNRAYPCKRTVRKRGSRGVS